MASVTAAVVPEIPKLTVVKAHIEGPPPLKFAGPHYRCPRCGHEESAGQIPGGVVGLAITFPEHAGIHCMKCFAKWVTENIPRMVEVDRK